MPDWQWALGHSRGHCSVVSAAVFYVHGAPGARGLHTIVLLVCTDVLCSSLGAWRAAVGLLASTLASLYHARTVARDDPVKCCYDRQLAG